MVSRLIFQFFFNEYLCPTLDLFFGATVLRKNEFGCKYAWTSNGRIFARKREQSKVIQIAHVDLGQITVGAYICTYPDSQINHANSIRAAVEI